MSEVLEFTRDDWDLAYSGAEGWVNGLGLRAIPPVQRFIENPRHGNTHVIADSRGIEVRFDEGEDGGNGWWLDVPLPSQKTAIWLLQQLPDDLSPEFCESIGFVAI